MDGEIEEEEKTEQSKSSLKVSSPDDSEAASRRQPSPNGTHVSRERDVKNSRAVSRRHTLGGARGSKEILAMQPSDMDKKREAFLEHLKHKYPHHASAIMGHQERLRDHCWQHMLSALHSELDFQSYLLRLQVPRKSRSPKHGPSPQPGAGDQVDHISLASLDSLEAMSEGDAPTAFTRGSRVRASLPVVRSTNQTKDRSLGVLYLQYGDETKQIRMPNEVTSMDTVRALFVSAFPQQLNMKMLESPSVAVYVKDDMRNVYYELSDIRNITDHSCLKVYHKDPAQAFNHGARPTNGDARMHGEMVHPGPHPHRQPPMGPPPHHPMQGALPPTPHSMPPSPSRIPFGSRQSSLPSSATMPRDRLSNVSTPVRSISPCPSAILERRDVKPDETGPNKSHSLTRGADGIYADPYMLANAHGPHPAPGMDGPEHSMGGFHRASIRSTGSYSGPSPTDSIDHPSLYRQKSRNTQLPTLGSKTPPPSPHRMAEVRMIDIHGPPHGMPPHGIPAHGIPPHGVPHGVPHGGPHGVPHGGPHGGPIERGSPVRHSLRKDDGAGPKARANMGSPVITEVPGHPQGPIPPANDKQTRERMKAMEQQIASLTGLVQHALLTGPNTSGTKESISERPPNTSSPAHSTHSSGGSPVLAPKTPSAPTAKVPVKVNLLQFRKNVSDLRMQLHQMRQLQLQNQEALRLQLKKAEQEISVKLAEAMQRVDDPVQMQRTVVEEDRHKYLSLEGNILTQLSELEQYVGSLQKDTGGAQRTVTLRDVEEGAVTLRKVGESLAGLKGEFPTLQTRMRAVLRVEVEAVKFLKEEPHKLDSMLKRVKMLTDILSGLRKSASESPQKTPANNPADSSPLRASPLSNPSRVTAPTVSTPALTESPNPSPPNPTPPKPTIAPGVPPSSPVVVQQMQSSMVLVQQSQQSTALTTQPSPTNPPSPPQSKVHGRESPKGVSVDPPTPKKANGNPPSNGNGTFHNDMVIEELQSNPEKGRNRALSIKAAEKEWEERRQNMGHYDGKEFEKILQEAQANMMKGIPNLESEEKITIISAASVEQTSTHNAMESPTEEFPIQSNTDKPVKRAPEKLPKPSKPTLERSSRVNTEQPPLMRQSSKDNGTKTEKASKSPPPPPPRKTFSSPTSGMTTTRSGEVVFTRKESTSTQEAEEEPPPPSPQPRSSKVPPETKPKPSTPPPVTPPATPPAPKEEEDEGNKIMAELQVFQMCSNKVNEVEVKNVIEPTPRIEPQIRELRAGSIMPQKDKKTTESKKEEKDPDTDENGNTTLRQSQGVIYYVTGQIPKELPLPPPGREDPPEPSREPLPPPPQVSNINVNSGSSEKQQQQQSKKPKSPTSPTSPPPISPKPVGLNGFKLPRKNMRRSESLKTSSEMEKGNLRNKINNEKKKEKYKHEHKPVITESLTVVKSDKEITARVVNVDRTLHKGNFEEIHEDASLSPDLPGEEAPPPPDNIAFKITNSKIQALSNGEYQELVNAKKGSVQTVTVGNASKPNSPVDSNAPQDNRFNKKPVIIIFDEPMDIRSAYKRLSTIFESEEEFERMLAEERIDEESEESDSERSGGQEAKAGDLFNDKKTKSCTDQSLSSSSSSSINDILDNTGNLESSGDGKEGKKKFKFKFPKKQLAAFTQAIRAGTKSGKKTLQVVVYEDEEESDGTIKQHKEAKRFEISRSKSLAERSSGVPHLKKQNSDSQCRTDEIRKNTYKTLDSLEQTIKQLETTISEMGPLSPDDTVNVEESNGKSRKSDANLKRSSSLPSSRGSGQKVPLKSALKKPKILPRPVASPTTTTTTTTASTTTSTTTSSDPSPPSVPCSIEQNASVVSPTSRMPVPLSAKSRQSSTEKAGKQQKLQDAQRQFRQANGSAKRVGGDHKTTSQSVPVSKIPAFYPSSTKGSSPPAPDNATNNINSFSSSSSSSSSLTITKSSMLPARSSSLPHPSSHIPSLSNGSLKLSQHTGKALSFSMQNGRVHPSSSSTSSSSSSPSPASTPSPLSPTPLGPGGKSIRTIHTPSFNSYRATHNGNGSGGKSCIPTVAKDTV